MTNNDFKMKNDVMNRVKSIYYMRTVVRPLLIKAGLFLVAVIAISSLVSIPNIISNMTQSQKDYVSYLFEAFLQTKLVVQVVLVMATIFFALFVQDLIKNLKYLKSIRFS